jgi:hypothetical protein
MLGRHQSVRMSQIKSSYKLNNNSISEQNEFVCTLSATLRHTEASPEHIVRNYKAFVIPRQLA